MFGLLVLCIITKCENKNNESVNITNKHQLNKRSISFFILSKLLKYSALPINSTSVNEHQINKRSVKIAYQLLNRGPNSGMETSAAVATLLMTQLKDSFGRVYDSIKNLNKPGNKQPQIVSPTKKINEPRKILSQRSVPSNIGENKILARKTRALKVTRKTRGIGVVLPYIGRFVTFAGGMAVAGVATSAADNLIKDKIARDNEERLARRTIDCDLNNVGCIENLCWTNCGPRLYSADWCFVTKNVSVPKEKIQFAACERDSDCQPCWPCASACIMEGSSINNTPGKISIN